MARHNVTTIRAASRGPLGSTGKRLSTSEWAIGYQRDARSELLLAAVSSLNEDQFYETAGQTEGRIRRLVGRLAVHDAEWLLELVTWLRGTAHLRSVPLMIAAHAVKARLEAGATGLNRALVRASLARADEPGEFLAYWFATFGRRLPMPVKRGLADVVVETWTERAWLKWRGKGTRGGFSMADVLRLVHPEPKSPWQAELFRIIIAESKGEALEGLDLLPSVEAREMFTGLDKAAQLRFVTGDGAPDRIRSAALTHEVLAGVLGILDRDVWEALLPTMGYQAVLMNLRRISSSGPRRKVVKAISRTLADKERVAASRMLPLAFLAAYQNAPLDFGPALEKAVQLSLANVPALPGRTLVLVDRSGSMFMKMSRHSSMTRADAASVFGAAVALRAAQADLVLFGSGSHRVPFRKGESLLRLASRGTDMGGTNTYGALAAHYRGHDRVVLVTDEQAAWHGQADVFDGIIPESVPTYTWNLAGYQAGHAPEGVNRYTFGGLTDAGFGMIPLLESGRDAGWPWEQ